MSEVTVSAVSSKNFMVVNKRLRRWRDRASTTMRSKHWLVRPPGFPDVKVIREGKSTIRNTAPTSREKPTGFFQFDSVQRNSAQAARSSLQLWINTWAQYTERKLIHKLLINQTSRTWQKHSKKVSFDFGFMLLSNSSKRASMCFTLKSLDRLSDLYVLHHDTHMEQVRGRQARKTEKYSTCF